MGMGIDAADKEIFVQLQQEGKLEKLELRNLSSMRVSNRIIPPSEISPRCDHRRSSWVELLV